MRKRNTLLFIIALIIVVVAVFRISMRTWPWTLTIPPLVINNPLVADEIEIKEPEEESKENEDIKVGREMPFAVNLPQGFKMGIFAEGLGNARVLLFDLKNRLLVSAPSQGKIIRLTDSDGDGFAELKETILTGLNRPHGLAFFEKWLYVAEANKIVRYEYDHNSGKVLSSGEKLIDLPGGGRHFTRTIGFDSNDKLFISIGSSCDTCLEDDENRAAIMISDPDGKNARIYASGLRNSVFFRWHPNTKELFATDMGRDFLGDNLPPDEVNIIKDGKGYGWPFCYGKRVYDTVFRGVDNCASSEPSFIDLPAHVAPLGLAFALKEWGKEWEGDLFISYHGSWNSSVPVGYKIVQFTKESNYQESRDFITGFINQKNNVLGRPVDLLFDNNGRLFISDDKSGMIYMVVAGVD